MKPESKISLMVFGIPVIINYAEDKVDYPSVLNSDKIKLAKLSNYICEEGFLDDEFIALCKSQS